MQVLHGLISPEAMGGLYLWTREGAVYQWYLEGEGSGEGSSSRSAAKMG